MKVQEKNDEKEGKTKARNGHIFLWKILPYCGSSEGNKQVFRGNFLVVGAIINRPAAGRLYSPRSNANTENNTARAVDNRPYKALIKHIRPQHENTCHTCHKPVKNTEGNSSLCVLKVGITCGKIHD